jgi:hypothetical protein
MRQAKFTDAALQASAKISVIEGEKRRSVTAPFQLSR